MTGPFFSQLHDEKTFYRAFLRDLEDAKEEVYIESPFITNGRMQTLRSIFEKLMQREVKVYILTRFPDDRDEFMETQVENEIQYFEEIGIQVFLAKCENQKMFHRN